MRHRVGAFGIQRVRDCARMGCLWTAFQQFAFKRKNQARSKPETWKICLFTAFLTCAVCLVSARQTFGQATTGTISGAIRDIQGGVVVGTAVSVRNLDTNVNRTLITDPDGRFRFSGLAVGPYELTIEHVGFARYMRGPILLLLNQDAVVNPVLKVAPAVETVTVTEDASLLNTTSPEVGVRFDARRLTDLPTLPSPSTGGGGFRDVFAFALAAPGVSQLNSGNQVFATGTNFSVNGSRARSNSFMIDGQDSNDPTVTGREQVMNNPEIVQEFRLITNQFSAESSCSSFAVCTWRRCARDRFQW